MPTTNSWNVVDWLTTEGLRLLTNKLAVAQFGNTNYNKEFTRDFAVGETVRVPRPFQPTIRTGLGYNPQAVTRIYTTVTVDQIFGVDLEWDDVQKALEVTRPDAQLRDQVLDPCMSYIAQEIDSRFTQYAYQHANNVVGVLGTDPTSTTITMQARQRLIEKACPPSGNKGFIIPPSVNTSLTPAIQSLFQPDDEVSRLFKEGSLGRLSGFKWYESMSLYSHTAGTWAGAVTITTTMASGDTTIAITCTNGDTFKKGDKIGITGFYAVNPMTRRTTTTATTMQVTVLADVTASGTSATLSISPAIYGPGSPYQNVNALPTATTALVLWPGTTSPNGKVGKVGLAIHPDAFALVGVKLETPKAVEMSSQQRDPDTGISIRFVKAWDPVQSKMIHRFDVLMGFGSLYSDNCAVAIACG
jgi:hypothetical protein